MNLIMEADAHGKETLQNQPDEIDALVHQNITTLRKNIVPQPPPRAGRMYADFAKEVNDAMEERDSALTQHRVRLLHTLQFSDLMNNQRDFDVKMGELAATHAYRRKLALGEHSALSGTLRDRLINSVTNKKNRLGRDRETVEIGDSNALLLHPSQYGLANPSSPGGIHGKRATRHRREADDLTSFPESHKRKRKAGDSDESPAPTRQRLDNGTSTPIWFAEKREITAQQVDSALFSIDKLFTEKELSMNYNAAALAAYNYIQRHSDDTTPNGQSNGNLEDLAAAIDPEAEDTDSAHGAPMERQYSHATRSTRGVAPNYVTGLGIDAIADLNIPGNMQAIIKQTPKMPPLLASVMQKGYVKGESANQPAGLSQDDAAAELEMIRQARQYNQAKGRGKNLELDFGGRTLLEEVSTPRKYNYWIKSDNKQMLESSIRDELPSMNMGSYGEPMSRNASDMGMGGTPMSRTNTGEGVTSSRGRKLKPTPMTA
jgi:hypothetical protein